MKRKYDKYIIIISLFIILSLIALVDINADAASEKNVHTIEEGQYSSAWRFWYFIIHDDKRDVTCYITNYGMSCLPDKDLKT